MAVVKSNFSFSYLLLLSVFGLLALGDFMLGSHEKPDIAET